MPGNPFLLQQDPTLQSALFTQLLSGGALDPRLSSPVAAEAFAKGLTMSPQDMNLLQSGLQTQAAEGQMALAGTNQGSAADTSRALLALQQGFQAQRFQPRGGGGGGPRYEDPIPVQPQDRPRLPTVGRGPGGAIMPAPKPPEPEKPPDWVRQFQHALRVADDFESTQNRVKKQLAGAPPGLGTFGTGGALGQESTEQFYGFDQMRRFKGAHSPEQAFALAFFGEIPRNPLGDPKRPDQMDNQTRAKEALRAWASGDEQKANAFREAMFQQHSASKEMQTYQGQQAMSRYQYGTARALSEELGGASNQDFKVRQLLAEVSPKHLQEALLMLRTGTDRELVKQYLMQNNQVQQTLARQMMVAGQRAATPEPMYGGFSRQKKGGASTGWDPESGWGGFYRGGEWGADEGGATSSQIG